MPYAATVLPRHLAPVLAERARQYPVVTLTGPRQSGKTTLCRAQFPDKAYCSLESMDLRAYAEQDPRGFLQDHRYGAILDEVQRVPALLSYLQEEVDRDPTPGRFILSGSQNFALSQAVTQSLAGRTAMLTLLPLSHPELGPSPNAPRGLWPALFAGGYPRIFDQGIPPEIWLGDYATTYVERDVRQLLNIGDLRAFALFLKLAAGRTAQELNLSALSGDVGVAVNTIRAWISVLEASYLVALLPAWHSTVRKQAIKAPKLHFLDTGLACYLLGIRSAGQVSTHPLRGALFESWIVSEIFKHRFGRGLRLDAFHYREPRGPEVDLMVQGEAGWVLAETKSGTTLDASFFGNLDIVGARLEAENVSAMRLIYGGSTASKRQGTHVVPWDEVGALVW